MTPTIRLRIMYGAAFVIFVGWLVDIGMSLRQSSAHWISALHPGTLVMCLLCLMMASLTQSSTAASASIARRKGLMVAATLGLSAALLLGVYTVSAFR